MLFPAMAWVVATGFGPTFRASADKLAYRSTHHTRVLMGVAGLSLSDNPWGEPPLTKESGPLRRRMSPENYSSIWSIKQFDERMGHALGQRLPGNLAKSAVEEPSPLRPVVFTLRQSHGGRIVRPESVLELNDNDSVRATGPGTPGMVVQLADKCSWQCRDNSAESLHSSR
jgi:hypothetical protein